MKEVNDLLGFIESKSEVRESKVSVNSQGISYKYVEYVIKFPKAFVLSMFRKAEYKLLKTYHKSELIIDNFNTVFVKQKPFKGSPIEAITLKRLVIL